MATITTVIPDPPYRSSPVVPENLFSAAAARLPKFVASREWMAWYGEVVQRVALTPARQTTPVALVGQVASIGTTPLNLGVVAAGLWRVNYSVRVTTAASTSSSIQVSVHWTDGAVPQTEAGAALVGNTTTTREGRSVLIKSDASSPISFSTVYASVGATPMQYALDVVAEAVALA